MYVRGRRDKARSLIADSAIDGLQGCDHIGEKRDSRLSSLSSESQAMGHPHSATEDAIRVVLPNPAGAAIRSAVRAILAGSVSGAGARNQFRTVKGRRSLVLIRIVMVCDQFRQIHGCHALFGNLKGRIVVEALRTPLLTNMTEERILSSVLCGWQNAVKRESVLRLSAAHAPHANPATWPADAHFLYQISGAGSAGTARGWALRSAAPAAGR